MTTVLDASAMIAMLLQEPGWETVAAVQTDALASAVNVSEVVAKLTERGAGNETARQAASTLGASVVDFDFEQAIQAGFLRNATRASGLSLGDRACLALAIVRDARVLTTNRAWASLDLGVEVEVIR